jgi:AraC-like DNA-binding protein
MKAATQKGFTAHLSLLRLHRSVDLLENSDETIDQIAKTIGYASRQTFIRKFQEFYGTTPGKYRRLRNLGTLDT